MSLLGQPRYSTEQIGTLVEADRVHRAVYIDPEIFELEMQRIWGTAWVYVGHESQIPNTGDYFSTEIARKPVIMVRHSDGSVKVLFNRCAHKGAEVVTNRSGNVKYFSCNYHGWTFRTDGTLANLPIRRDYENTCFDFNNPNFHLAKVPRVDSYRGFVFASLAGDGPDLRTFLGPAAEGFDDMCDRAPDGEVVAAGSCARSIQKSNWKFFVENQLDNVHAGIVHLSSQQAADAVAEKHFNGDKSKQPRWLVALQMQVPPEPDSFWTRMNSHNFKFGHAHMLGYQNPRGDDPITLKYEALLRDKHGAEKAERFLARSFHHTVIYPCLSVQSQFQQLRVVKPIAVDRTLMEIWHFRLKGAPPEVFTRNLVISNTVNSPSTIVSCDDYETWYRCHEGLKAMGNDWVSLHRSAGQDIFDETGMHSNTGTSEAWQRNQFAAWREYMSVGA